MALADTILPVAGSLSIPPRYALKSLLRLNTRLSFLELIVSKIWSLVRAATVRAVSGP